MNRLLILLPFLINQTFAQVYAPDSTFCFQPVDNIFDSKLIADDNFLIPQSDGGYVFIANFNIINGQKVENPLYDQGYNSFFKFDRQGNFIPSYPLYSREASFRYFYFGRALKNGKMLWYTGYDRHSLNNLVRINENGSLDKTFNYHYDIKGTINNLFVLSSGKILVSTEDNRLSVINENGSLANSDKINFPNLFVLVSSTFYENNDYILAGSYDKSFKVFKINSDLTLKEIYSGNLNSIDELPYIKLSVDLTGRLYLILFDEGLYSNKIIRLNADGKADSSFKTILTNKTPVKDPHSAKLTFTNSGKIIFSRTSSIMSFNDDGTQDSLFKIPATEKDRTIYDVTKEEEILMEDINGLKKIDFNGNKLTFQLKLQSLRPKSFYDILTAGKGKFYSLSNHYVARVDSTGKIESEFYSPDTVLAFKKYFDKQLLIKRGNTSYIFSGNGLKEEKIPEVVWKGTFDLANRKVYLIEKDKIVRYDEYGKEEIKFTHSIPGLKELFVLSTGKFMAISETFSADTSFVFYKMYRMNIDGSIDLDFQPVDIRESYIGRVDFYFNTAIKTFNIMELPNGNICVEHHYIKTDGPLPIIKLFNNKGVELTANIKKNDPKIQYSIETDTKVKVGSNNTLLLLSEFSKVPIQHLTAEAVLDTSFSIKGINSLTAFESIDVNSLLVASNEKIYKLSRDKQRFITLLVPDNIDIEGKPIIVKAISSDGTPIELSISGVGVLKDSVITWDKEGSGTIEAKFKGIDCYSVSSHFSIRNINPLWLPDIPAKETNSPPFDVTFEIPTIDTSLVKFKVIEGEAYMIGNRLYLKGQPGKVCVETIRTNPNNNIVITSIRCFEVTNAIIAGDEKQQNSAEPIKIYPNPSTTGFYLRVNNTYNLDEESVQLFDITGKIISLEFLKEGDGHYYLKPLSKPTKGIYLLKLNTTTKSVTKRIMFE